MVCSLQERISLFSKCIFISVFSGQKRECLRSPASPRHLGVAEVFSPQDENGIILFKTPARSSPPPPKKIKTKSQPLRPAALAGRRLQASRGSLGARTRRPRAPRLPRRRRLFCLAHGGAGWGGVRGRGWDSEAAPFQGHYFGATETKPQPGQLLFTCFSPNYHSTLSFPFPGAPREEKKKKKEEKENHHPPTTISSAPSRGGSVISISREGRPKYVLLKRCRETRGKDKKTNKKKTQTNKQKKKTNGGLTLPSPPGPACAARQRAGGGTRAGRRARPGRARPQARLIFMSGREAPLLHGRPAGPRRPPPAFVPFPPSSGPPSLRTRGRGPSAPAGRPPRTPSGPAPAPGGVA